MSRPAVAVICAAVLAAGFIAGRVTGSGSSTAVTVSTTVERAVVVPAQHLGSARDSSDAAPFDLARVASVRRGYILQTTIVARHAWPDSLLKRGRRVSLFILYDTNGDGTPDHRDRVFQFHGQLASWISDLGQGVQAADVTRPSPTTVSVARDATVFFNAAGQAGLLATAAIGVAVDAHWKGGGDRVPNHGWITVPPPAG